MAALRTVWPTWVIRQRRERGNFATNPTATSDRTISPQRTGLARLSASRVNSNASALPFDELRARSHINAAAREAADAEDFPERIRVGLPTIRSPEPAPAP